MDWPKLDWPKIGFGQNWIWPKLDLAKTVPSDSSWLKANPEESLAN